MRFSFVTAYRLLRLGVQAIRAGVSPEDAIRGEIRRRLTRLRKMRGRSEERGLRQRLGGEWIRGRDL